MKLTVFVYQVEATLFGIQEYLGTFRRWDEAFELVYQLQILLTTSGRS